MANTIPTSSDGTLANPRRGRLDGIRMHSAKARIAANALPQTALLPLVRRAMSETNISQKAFALNADIPESVLSEALNGRRTFAAEWWWAQPDAFLVRFLDLVVEVRGLTPETVSAVRRRRIVELIDLLLVESA